jgi:kynureninase
LDHSKLLSNKPYFPDVKLSDDEAQEECIYLCGNSLGLMPLAAKLYQDEQMMKWAQL